MAELMLPNLDLHLKIPVILDVVDIEIPPLLGKDVLNGNILLVDNVTNRLWSRIITNKDSLRFEDMWKIKLISNAGYLYIPVTMSLSYSIPGHNYESFKAIWLSISNQTI